MLGTPRGNQVFSSFQWFSALDSLLSTALTPLLEQTNLIPHYVSQLVNYQNAYKKRRVSRSHGWRECISAMVEFLRDPSLESFGAVDIDRGFTIAMLADFDRLTSGYLELYSDAFRAPSKRLTTAGRQLEEYHSRVGFKDRDMVQLVSHVRHCLKDVTRLKHMLLKSYESYIHGMARYDSKNHPLNADYDDLRQGYFVAADKAINHFNIERGTFKPYLDFWLLKSRNGNHHFYGAAFNIPGGVKTNHLYVPLDALEDSHDSGDDSPYDIVNKRQESDTIMQLALLVDPDGYAIQALQLGDNL